MSDSLTSNNVANDEMLAEQLASLLNRYAALRGLDSESLLMEIEKQLESLGYQCIEGVWQKSN
jgi:hypothetical protein